jgi:tRNA A-37 threonylcarbamoyl transferase component Bud32
MSEPQRCAECGADLPSGVLAGMCPRCLLGAGMASQDDAQRASGTGSEVPTSPHPGRFVPPDPAALAAHFSQLEIVELLGCGGMGAVYKARQTRLDRLVALKIIRPESADTPSFAERFNREARLLARLSHPHIVAIHDFGDVRVPDAAGAPGRTLYYFLMEYVDGANLRQLLEAGELTPQQALTIVPQICEALQYAHDEGVIHRDIKPENILLDKRGRVKIADFGLAKLAARSAEEFTLTGTHQVMGTPRYMAPEQMEGSHTVDHRADIYSLGVVFYEMLTGEVPAGHFQPPSKKVEIDVRLDDVVLHAMAREPERRYQQVSELKTDVESMRDVSHERSAARARAVKPFPWIAFWVGLAGLASVLGVVLFAMVWTGSPWPLLGVALPWFAIGLMFGFVGGGDKELEEIVRAVYVHVGLLLAASAGLIAYGVVLSASGWPLWAAAAFAAVFVAGGAFGYSAATDGEATSDADDEAGSEGEQRKTTPSDKSSDVPGGPMILVGTIATITLASSGGDDLLAWLRGESLTVDWSWQFLLGGPIVVLGGMAMLQRRAYWLAIVASLACVPLGLGSDNVVIRLIPLALGLYSLYWLVQLEVREAFGYAGRPEPD